MGIMKNLLNKTLKTFSIYSLLVLIISVPAYYYLIDNIWLNELDENNELIAERTEQELNRLNLNKNELEKSLFLWNKIQPHTSLKELESKFKTSDSTYTTSRQNPYAKEVDINRFRGLQKTIKINNTYFLLTIETIVEESEETVWAIAKLTFLFFILLVIGFLVLNRRLSYQLWKPFRHTLSQLKSFQLNKQSKIEFTKSNTVEFEELNTSLTKLIEQNISAYKSQKEFTEYASHELQTPLALIKGKLDLLIQQESLTNRQYDIVEEINLALTRVSRINKNLLLLAKMENHQFEKNSDINISDIMLACLKLLDEHFSAKKIIVMQQIEDCIIVEGNSALIEILVNNLLLNTIKHAPKNSNITVVLNKKGIIVSNFGQMALNKNRLFNRFSSVTENASGSGLGLAIIKQVCEVHHWNITYNYQNNSHIFSVEF